MSRGVAPSGVMSLPRASYSKETQEMLKCKFIQLWNIAIVNSIVLTVMMAESKLTNFQQRKLQETLKGYQLIHIKVLHLHGRLIGGGSLPLRCNPTSSSDGPARVREAKGRRNTRSKECKTGLRSKATIEVIQQSQKDDCEGLYTPTKPGINYDHRF